MEFSKGDYSQDYIVERALHSNNEAMRGFAFRIIAAKQELEHRFINGVLKTVGSPLSFIVAPKIGVLGAAVVFQFQPENDFAILALPITGIVAGFASSMYLGMSAAIDFGAVFSARDEANSFTSALASHIIAESQ